MFTCKQISRRLIFPVARHGVGFGRQLHNTRRWQNSKQSQDDDANKAPVRLGAAQFRRSKKETAERILMFTGSLAIFYLVASYIATNTNPKFFESESPSVPKYANSKQIQQAISEIREILGEEYVSTEASEVKRHGYSEWATGRTNIPRLPDAVIYPKSTEEVSEIAKICNKFRIPMIPYSGGSSIEGHFTAPYGGFSIDFGHMDKILHVYEDDLDVVVQPGVNWLDLNQRLAPSGLFFPVDPGPTAQFGGMVATNCSGTNAVRYGAMKDWVINLTVVLADGRIIKTKKRPHKSSAGYNLNSLIVGSEGTLGLVTEITLKLAVIPQHFSVAVVPFPTIGDAAATAAQVIKAGIPIAAMELIDETMVKVINQAHADDRTARLWTELPTMFLKFSGSKASVADNITQVQKIAMGNNGVKFEFARNEAEQKELWSARKEALWSMHAAKREGTVLWSTDVAVPMSRFVELIEISKKEMDKLAIFSSLVAHLGDGNFHEAIMYDPENEAETKVVKLAVDRMIQRALDMEGTSSGEHGIGLGKKDCLMKELGEDTIDVMKSIKASLDPHWLMNPGKIFDVPVRTKSWFGT